MHLITKATDFLSSEKLNNFNINQFNIIILRIQLLSILWLIYFYVQFKTQVKF